MDQYVINNFNHLPLLNKAGIICRHGQFLHAQNSRFDSEGNVHKVSLYRLDCEYVEVVCNAKYQIIGVWMCDYDDLEYHLTNIEITYALNAK